VRNRASRLRASAARKPALTAARHSMIGVDDAVLLGDGLVTTAGLMTRVNVTDAVVPAVAVMVTEKLPDAVGVPLIVPVSELIVSPPGSPLAAHVAAPVPPLAVTVAL
jgi:hypothetical protein